MAEQQFQERTERATPKRIKDARDKGQIPRSRELNAAAIMVGASASLFLLGNGMSQGIAEIMRNGLSLPRTMLFDTTAISSQFVTMIKAGLMLIAPSDHAVANAAGGQFSSFMPSDSSCWASTSLISVRDFLPRFGVFSSSTSVR